MSDIKNRIGVLGATSLVGKCLLPLLTEARLQVTAFSRQEIESLGDGVEWRPLSSSPPATLTVKAEEGIPLWVCVAPIWVLLEYFDFLEAHGARRVVVLSSTSRFTKNDSADSEEQYVARRLADAETHVQKWAENSGVEWVILRPTLIYGLGRDKNISEIARFICRFGFFPLFGKACGLRQPIHAADVASACLAALHSHSAVNRAYNISGGEMLAYRDMVIRIFTALGRRPHLLTVPLWAFRLAVAMLHCIPRYRKWSSAMAERMNRDLVFDHAEAARDLGFKPRMFVLGAGDWPA